VSNDPLRLDFDSTDAERLHSVSIKFVSLLVLVCLALRYPNIEIRPVTVTKQL